MADQRTKSGEYNPQHELMKSLAFEAADAVITRFRAERSREEGERSAQFSALVTSVGEMRGELKTALSQQARQEYQLGSHSEQIRALNKDKEGRQERVEAIARAAAQAVLQEEVVERSKNKRSAWDTLLPSVIGSVLAATITAGLLFFLSAARAPNPPSSSSPASTGATP